VPKSDLPFGSELSPRQIDLLEALALARTHEGSLPCLEAALRARFFADPTRAPGAQRTLAMNCRLSLQSYGLVGRDGLLTELGAHLLGLSADPDCVFEEFARHILLNLHGLTLAQCLSDMRAAGERIGLTSVRQALAERGVNTPRGTKTISTMRAWLAQAAVMGSERDWCVHWDRIRELVGVAEAELDALASLTREQKAYARTIANMVGPVPFRSNEVERLAAATYGVAFDEKNLPKTVLYPLQDAGLLTLERDQKATGRGGKPFLVTPTAEFDSAVLEPLLAQFAGQVNPELRPFLRRPLTSIIDELRAPSKHTKGLALEALALRLMRLIDLEYRATRLRGSQTGGAEVDLVFESARLLFSRWQVQCKNTRSVSLDDVAKEVGLTHTLKSNVVVVVTTGRIGGEARRYAEGVMSDSNLHIALIEGADLCRICATPADLVSVLGREARRAMEIKAINV